MRKYIRVVVLVVLILFVVVQPVLAEESAVVKMMIEDDTKKLIKDFPKDSVVEIMAKAEEDGMVSMGTGFFVSSEKLITAAHVVQTSAKDNKVVLFRFYCNEKEEGIADYSKWYSSSVDKMSIEDDIAILTIIGYVDHQIKNLNVVPNTTKDIAVDDRIIINGYAGDNVAISDGTVRCIRDDVYVFNNNKKEKRQNIMKLSAFSTAGMSGSPVIIPQSDKVIGMVVSSGTYCGYPTSIVPAETILSLKQ